MDFCTNQPVNFPMPNGISLTMKREDLLHPNISGNKFRKLKYNIIFAKENGFATLLTFGGAYSNHIAATAAAGQEYGIKTIGIIRGDELGGVSNPTLDFAKSCDMQLHFVSREEYRRKNEPNFLESLYEKFGKFYLVPEGGTNNLAVKGCEEILAEDDAGFTHITCAVGTGGTISGLINSALPHQEIIGFPVLKAGLSEDILTFARKGNWTLADGYHFGGYGKVTGELVHFMNDFYDKTGIPLDPVYTAKMVFGVIDLAGKGYFETGASILMVHTGGLQGIAGINELLARKKMPLIKTNTNG
ncbi:MAG: 1-aminocyclopropane-1-carboxylate deaminase/D-cysteine desulfhydrase [Flavobacterium sp.]